MLHVDPANVGSGVPAPAAQELAYALVDRFGVREGIRLLATGELVALAQGVRTTPSESRVTFLAAPADVETARSALQSIGWTPDDDGFNHPEWNISLDVLDRHPAFRAAPDAVFDAIWEAHEYVWLAGIQVYSVDVVWTVLLVAADQLALDTQDQRAALTQLARRAAGLLDADQADQLASYVDLTGLHDVLKPFVEDVRSGQTSTAETAL